MKTRFIARRAYRAALIQSARMDDMLLLWLPAAIIVGVVASIFYVHLSRG
jgi:nitrate reductase gamma subunit